MVHICWLRLEKINASALLVDVLLVLLEHVSKNTRGAGLLVNLSQTYL